MLMCRKTWWPFGDTVWEVLLEDVYQWGVHTLAPLLYFSLCFLCGDELWWASLTVLLLCSLCQDGLYPSQNCKTE